MLNRHNFSPSSSLSSISLALSPVTIYTCPSQPLKIHFQCLSSDRVLMQPPSDPILMSLCFHHPFIHYFHAFKPAHGS
jgi:hypothetical protein